MHKCPRCGAVCDCERIYPVPACFHECESWTGHQHADPFAEALEKGDVVPLDDVRRELKDTIAAHERWHRGEFTDAELVTLALFSAEHLGQPWQEVLDAVAIEDLLEAAEPDGNSRESDGKSPESDATGASE